MSAERTTVVLADPSAVAEAAAQRLVERIQEATGTAAICLTGGSTPKKLYELLATPTWRARVPWARVHWFISDDRVVPHDDPLSNGAMARHAFLDACAAPGTVHLISTTLPPDDAAKAYQTALETFQQNHRTGDNLFDAVFLGVGPDGHVASLFPGSEALSERHRWVVGVAHANVAPFVPRVSLTLPCLSSTREMTVIVTGSGKRDILRRILSGEDLPAAHIKADAGETIWLLDDAAAPPEAL